MIKAIYTKKWSVSKEEGFKILPKRRIVERTLGWISRYRRLSKDDEGV
jgi:transposase